MRASLARRTMIGGLLVTLLGAGLGTYGVWVSDDDAIEIGVSRFNGDNKAENLRLPAVQNLIHQSRFAVWGFILIGLGTALQIVSVVANKRE